MRSLISLTFDDGLRCQFERAVPILDRLGMPATFFVTANRDPTHELWLGHTDDWLKIDWRADDIANLKKLIDRGHEIGSHSLSHHKQKMRSDPLAEARLSKELMEGWLGTKITSFCYPYCSSSYAYLAEAVKSAGYTQARGGAQYSYYALNDRSFDRFNVDCRKVSASASVAEWVRPGYCHILMFHAIGDQRDGWAPISERKFATLIGELARYRDEGAVEIFPFSRAVAELVKMERPTT
jgi:peptidoglycan/xylan/chitin deacetylase (PgdA/CDA1 family)